MLIITLSLHTPRNEPDAFARLKNESEQKYSPLNGTLSFRVPSCLRNFLSCQMFAMQTRSKNLSNSNITMAFSAIAGTSWFFYPFWITLSEFWKVQDILQQLKGFSIVIMLRWYDERKSILCILISWSVLFPPHSCSTLVPSHLTSSRFCCSCNHMFCLSTLTNFSQLSAHFFS